MLVVCSLVARWQGSSRARPAASRECARGPPLPTPPRAPPPSAPRWGRAVSRLWRGVFMRGAPRPPPLRSAPCAPPPAPPSLGMCGVCWWWWCPLVCGGVVRWWCGGGGRSCALAVGGGVRGPSVVLRPPRFGADVGCRPMCPAPRPRPSLASALCALIWLCRVWVRPCAPRSSSALGRYAPRADAARCAPVLAPLASAEALRAFLLRFLSFRHDISLLTKLNNVKVLLPLCSNLVNTSVSQL